MPISFLEFYGFFFLHEIFELNINFNKTKKKLSDDYPYVCNFSISPPLVYKNTSNHLYYSLQILINELRHSREVSLYYYFE